ncbi:MAG: hypothetical protein ACK52I_01560 [Pseudomonadota bacterium]|jgi:phosphopantetheinyl transferase
MKASPETIFGAICLLVLLGGAAAAIYAESTKNDAREAERQVFEDALRESGARREQMRQEEQRQRDAAHERMKAEVLIETMRLERELLEAERRRQGRPSAP